MASAQSANGRTTPAPAPTERAEAIVEDVAERVGRGLSRAVARAREEAEDIWAEAQEMRERWAEPDAGGAARSTGVGAD